MDDIFSWARGVKTINSFLDESYVVSLAGKGVSGPGRIPWGRIGVEKFYARVIPLITGDRDAKRLTSTIRTACHDAICYGNSTILVFDDGSIAVSDPTKSVATRNRYGSVIFESHEVIALNPMPLPELVSVDGTLMARNWDAEEDEDPYVVVGRSFSIFFKEGPRGQSRITPAIQRIIEAQARSELRTEEAENFYTWPMRIINGVWDGFAEEMGGDVKSVLTGVNKLLAIPKDPETGEKATTDTWTGGDPSKPEVTKQSRMKDVAAAFNIDAQELGFTSSQFSSAEAISTAKEDLVLEIQEFTANIFDSIQDFLEFAALVRGFQWEDFSWASPSTPSIGSRTDAFVKIAAVLPQIKYSKEAILEAGLFSPKVIESLFRERDAEELLQLSIRETEAQLRGQIEAAGGEA